MGLFSGQLSSVVEWEEYRDDVIFWKFANKEIKKGSRLIIRQGQDAIFMYNGIVEGILFPFYLRWPALSLALTAVCGRRCFLSTRRSSM